MTRRSKSITPAQASTAMSAGELVLVDVREPAELAEARVRGAIRIPLGQLPARVTEARQPAANHHSTPQPEHIR